MHRTMNLLYWLSLLIVQSDALRLPQSQQVVLEQDVDGGGGLKRFAVLPAEGWDTQDIVEAAEVRHTAIL